MATGLIDVIKRAAMEAIHNAQMCDLRVGTVTSINPLRVQVTNQFTVPEALLIVPKNLTDYDVDILLNGMQSSMTVYNSLKVGDKVALLRKTGGQSYFILDRI